MQSRLIVKDFGPIKFVDLDLRNVNVFIGPQASGKSAVAKIYTIFKAPRKFLRSSNGELNQKTLNTESSFKEILEEYNIHSFLKSETEIQFDSELHSVHYKDGNLIYTPKLQKKIQELEGLNKEFLNNKESIIVGFEDLSDKFIFFDIRVHNILKLDNNEKYDYGRTKKFNNLTQENFSKIIDIIKAIENNLSTNAALYIPAERNFINIIKNFSLNLLLNNVPIPKHILSFGAELEKSPITEIDLNFLHENLMYKSVNGEDRIYTDNNNSIKLTEAASGIQSVLPILIPVLHRRTTIEHRSFVIEEPELNLFPLAQYELIKYLESSRQEVIWEDYGTIHTYTTHSPYILSALNNLLFANRVKTKMRAKAEERVDKIIPTGINPYYFTAYQICDGNAKPIFNRESGLIDENYIDEASDRMGDDFDALMELVDENKQPIS